MRLPPTGANGLETRDGQKFKRDVNNFFADLLSPVCTKFPKTLGCPKTHPQPDPGPPITVPVPSAVPNPPGSPNPPGNPGKSPTSVPPAATKTTGAGDPAQTTPAASPPPATTTTPAPVVPAPQPTQSPGNGNDGNGNGGGGGGGGNGGSSPSPDPTQGGNSAQPQPTTTRTGQGNGLPKNLGGNVLLVASETASGPHPTSFADSQSNDDPAAGPVFGSSSDGPGPARLLIDNDSRPQSASPATPTGDSNNGFNVDDGSGSPNLNGDGGPNLTSSENSNSRPSPVAGIVGAVVSLLVLLLILLALLYKYRRTRRVQSFLIKFTPFKIAPYSKLDRKRSSIGSELMFGCRGEVEPYTDEKRPWSVNYGNMDTAPTAVTHPNPVAARRSSRDNAPPVLNLDISLANSVRSASPTSQFEPSPLSPSFPNMRTPPPARHSPRSSQDTIGGLSIASSRVSNPFTISWPQPPSTSHSVAGSPPSTANTYDTGPIIVGRSTPTRYKPIQPAQPSNWERPHNWG